MIRIPGTSEDWKLPPLTHEATRAGLVTSAEADELESRIRSVEDEPEPTVDTLSGATSTGKTLMKATDAGTVRAALDVPSTATLVSSTRSVARASGVAILGDSITGYNSNAGDVWHKVLATLSTGRLPHRGFFATSGFTLAQIEATHVPTVLNMARKPGSCIIAGGTNDVGSASYDQTASRAALLRIIDKLQTAGIMPILWTLPPRDDSTTVNALVQRWNVWVRYLAQSLGLPLVDAHAALTDPATGKYLAGLKTDDVHPNRAGHYQIGKRAALDADFTRRFPSGTPHLSDSKLDAANLIPSGYYLFDSGVNGAGVPTGWGAYGATAYTPSIITDTAIVGKWLRLTKTSAQTGAGGMQINATTGFAAGDTIALAVRVKSSAADSGIEALNAISLIARAAGVNALSVSPFGSGGTFDGIAYCEMVLPAGTDTIRLDISINGTVTSDQFVQVAQPTIVNLTALGVA